MMALLPKIIAGSDGVIGSEALLESGVALAHGVQELRTHPTDLQQKRTPLLRVRKHLQKKDAKHVVMASDLNMTTRQELCASGRALTFTTVRSPWERLASAYLGKIADGSRHTRGVNVAQVREFWGLGDEEPISFSRFVRYVARQPDESVNIHFMPQSVRCGAGLGHYVIESRIESSFAGDVKLMLRAIGKSEALFEDAHISSTGKCLESKACTANLEVQIGPRATWEGDSTVEIARKLYKVDSEHDLPEMVRQRFSDDSTLLGYSWP